MNGKQLRLRRLFFKGRSVTVPMDHPVYFGPLPGVADAKGLVQDIAAASANEILRFRCWMTC